MNSHGATIPGNMQIAVIHQNSLCCLAMRTILTDIAPFMGMMNSVSIDSFNSVEDFFKEDRQTTFLFFVSKEILESNIDFFRPLSRRTIVLCEGSNNSFNEFKHIDVSCPEQEVVKSMLMIHNNAHSSVINHKRDLSNERENFLSQREKEVLELMVKGYINKEIADRLNISTSTVIFHRKNICERVGSKSIGRLTIYAVMNGIVDLREL